MRKIGCLTPNKMEIILLQASFQLSLHHNTLYILDIIYGLRYGVYRKLIRDDSEMYILLLYRSCYNICI